MKSIRMKIVTGILVCSVLTAILIGIMSIVNSISIAKQDAHQQMEMAARICVDDLNATISGIEQSVDFLSDLVIKDFDYAAFKKDKGYADQYTGEIEDTVVDFALNTRGAITVYVRYNPEYSNPTSGIFATRNSTEEDFELITPTDFSMYEKDDISHVGWYYVPVGNGGSTWMEPYVNENINVYMFSYIVPLFGDDGESIGVVGMDIEFSTITDMVDAVKLYDTGYAFLANREGKLMYHKNLETGLDLASLSLTSISKMLASEEAEGTLGEYIYDNVNKHMVYERMDNGMCFVLTVPKAEFYSQANRLILYIGIGILVAILFSGVIGMVVGSGISKPITMLTDVIGQTARLDFTPTHGKGLRKQKDEIGVMANEIHQMRKTLRDMTVNMNRVENTILEDVEKLDLIMQENSMRSEDNSAATQEMAAGMQEVSNNTGAVLHSIEEVKKNSESIYRLAQDGESNSEQIAGRAGEMERVTKASSEKTNSMYGVMKEKTDMAIEKSQAVKRINELTEDIKSISTQTNLLALNASIEAARAGEAGRGFAVVATEIGALAAQTLQTTDHISVIVNEVNDAVSNMTECITVMMDFLESTVLNDYDVFRESGIQYRADADSYRSVMGQIKEAIEELNTYIATIMKAVDDINETVSQSSEGINVIAEKSTETVDTTMEGYEKLRESRESIKALTAIVAQFKM